jgi:hypothetical protein
VRREVRLQYRTMRISELQESVPRVVMRTENEIMPVVVFFIYVYLAVSNHLGCRIRSVSRSR